MLHTMFLCVTAPPPLPVRHSEGMELRLGRERPSYSRSFLSMLLSRDPEWGGPESCLSPQVTPLGCDFALSLRVLLRWKRQLSPAWLISPALGVNMLPVCLIF